jgi:hypothetical protein
VSALENEKGREKEESLTRKLSHLEQREPRANASAPPVRRGDDAQLGGHGGVAVRAGPELGQRELKGLVFLDAVCLMRRWWLFFGFFFSIFGFSSEQRRKKKKKNESASWLFSARSPIRANRVPF